MTVAGARARARAALAGACPEARVDADLLLAHVLGRSRAWLVAHDRDSLDGTVLARLDALATRRRAGEPMAYLLGHREFWSLELSVTPDVLIPRHETECLVERALMRLPPDTPACAADLGTGSGAVALALASERPLARILATDVSTAALAVAAGNVRRLARGRVALARASWLDGLRDAAFDLLVSNPPYVAAGDPHLAQGDVRHEPALALTPGGDGLGAIRRIAHDAPRRLRPRGWLLLEHGFDQGDAVRRLLAGAGLHAVATHRDAGGRERVTEGRR